MQYKKIYVYIYFFYVSCTNNSTIISICFFCELHFFCRLSPFAYFSSLLKVGIQHSGRLYSFPPPPLRFLMIECHCIIRVHIFL